MPTKPRYDATQLQDLILQMMETELGGEKVYKTALTCTLNEDLRKEWGEYLEETLNHQNVVRTMCEQMGIDPDMQTPSRLVVKHIGEFSRQGNGTCQDRWLLTPSGPTGGLRMRGSCGNEGPLQLGASGQSGRYCAR